MLLCGITLVRFVERSEEGAGVQGVPAPPPLPPWSAGADASPSATVFRRPSKPWTVVWIGWDDAAPLGGKSPGAAAVA